ncbi:MAG: hypothetical protein LBL49_06040 [Clostridiales Family XIII bacterium]|nr:hypothetical protein [Clostridiales Family XIII bacterium]
MGSSRVQTKVNSSLQINPIIDGVAYEITSSNPAVASVNHYGTVTPRKAGTTIITLRATDGSELTASVLVTVTI